MSPASPPPIRSVLILSPEAPYPLHGGGQYRTASLIHYFAQFADVDLILISASGQPALLPPNPDGSPLLRSQTVISLPVHGKGKRERYFRNARRALMGVPPLIDRLSGLGERIENAIRGNRYDIGVAEHFWLAPYFAELQAACGQTVLDLHNVESMLHYRCELAGSGLIGAGHWRFARAARKLEADLLPRFSTVLVTSGADRDLAQSIAPSARIVVYPNALPLTDQPQVPHQSGSSPAVVFSGNFEYHPNIDAVRFVVSEIWPLVRKRIPGARLRLVGRGDSCIQEFIRPGMGIETSGPVPDALREIAAADLVIAPLRMGSGTRIKILEAWAAARAVVATPLAAEGLAIRDGDNIALAGTPADFAETMLRLLSSPDSRKCLGDRGRLTFERHYTWEAVWRDLDMNLCITPHRALSRYTE